MTHDLSQNRQKQDPDVATRIIANERNAADRNDSQRDKRASAIYQPNVGNKGDAAPYFPAEDNVKRSRTGAGDRQEHAEARVAARADAALAPMW